MRRTREQKRAELLQAAQAMIEEYLDWEEQAARPKLSEIEEVVLKLRRQLGQRMAEVAVEDQDAVQPVEPPVCPHCGARLRYKGQKGRMVESRVGTIALQRGYYYCARCQAGLFPPRGSA